MLRQFDSVSGRLLPIGVCFTELLFSICVQRITFASLSYYFLYVFSEFHLLHCVTIFYMCSANFICFTELLFSICVQRISFAYANLLLMAIS